MTALAQQVADYDLLRYTWDYVPHFTKEMVADPQTLWLVMSSMMVFFLVHSGWSAFFAYVDLTGKWDKYRLCKTNRTVDASNYITGLKNLMFDLVFLFLPANFLVMHYHRDRILNCEDPIAWGFAKLSMGYVCGKIWSYWIHRWLHLPIFYKRIHKKHHVTVKNMVSTHAWYETIPEFIVMEIPNIFIAVLVAPTHLWILWLYFAFHGTGGANDHCGFKYNWWIDGTYHYNHHLLFDCNYGELETLDLVFQTHDSTLFPGKAVK